MHFMFDHPQSGVIYNFSRVCLSVCMYVCMYGMYVCLSDDNYQKPSRWKFIFAHPVYFQEIQVKFVKVIGSWSRSQEQKGRKCLYALINFHLQFSSVLTRWRHSPRLVGGHTLD